MQSIAFFNNKGGVGKTTLVYHLAWMLQDMGKTVLVADLDPQANLTGMFLDDDAIEKFLFNETDKKSIYDAVLPLIRGTGDIVEPDLMGEGPYLIPGHLALSGFEDELGDNWTSCAGGKERGFLVISSLYRIVKRAAEKVGAELVLLDVGPNLGAMNRAVLISSEYFITPLGPDMYSLQGLRNLGPTLEKWRKEWRQRLGAKPDHVHLALPGGKIVPLGYIVMQHAERGGRPVKSYDRWIQRIPETYHDHILRGVSCAKHDDDPFRLAMLKHYRSLMPMAMETRKPMFGLRAADGAFGSHAANVSDCRRAFQALAEKIVSRLCEAGGEKPA